MNVFTNPAFYGGLVAVITSITSLVIAIKTGHAGEVTNVRGKATQRQVDRITDHIINGGRPEDIISSEDEKGGLTTGT